MGMRPRMDAEPLQPAGCKLFATVASYDARKGKATVRTDGGKLFRVPWEVLRSVEVLAVGQTVVVRFDAMGFVSGLRLAREELQAAIDR